MSLCYRHTVVHPMMLSAARVEKTGRHSDLMYIASVTSFFVTVFQSPAIQRMSRAMTRVGKTAYCTGRLNPVLQLFFLLDKPVHSKRGPGACTIQSPPHSNKKS